MVESIIQIMKIYSDCSANCVLKFFKTLFKNTRALLYDIDKQLLEKVYYICKIRYFNLLILYIREILCL